MVTKKKVAAHYNVDVSEVKQIDKKQLFIVTINGYDLLVSYYTCIGVRDWRRVFKITPRKYSKTTSKQVSTLKYPYVRVSEIEHGDKLCTIFPDLTLNQVRDKYLTGRCYHYY